MIKEKVCYVSLDPKREEKDWMNSYHKSEAKSVEYALPDGFKIKVFRSFLPFPRSTRELTYNNRSDKNDTAPLRFFSIPSSLVLNIPVFTKLFRMPLSGQTWTCGNPYT